MNNFMGTRVFRDFIEKHYQNTKSVEEDFKKKELDKSAKIQLRSCEAKLKIKEMQLKRLKLSWKTLQDQERETDSPIKSIFNGNSMSTTPVKAVH